RLLAAQALGLLTREFVLDFVMLLTVRTGEVNHIRGPLSFVLCTACSAKDQGLRTKDQRAAIRRARSRLVPALFPCLPLPFPRRRSLRPGHQPCRVHRPDG